MPTKPSPLKADLDFTFGSSTAAATFLVLLALELYGPPFNWVERLGLSGAAGAGAILLKLVFDLADKPTVR